MHYEILKTEKALLAYLENKKKSNFAKSATLCSQRIVSRSYFADFIFQVIF